MLKDDFRGCGRKTPAKGRRAKADAQRRESSKELQAALLEHGAEPAMVMVILGLMGATGTVRIRRCRRMDFQGGAVAPEVLTVFEKYRPVFADCLDDQIPLDRGLRLRYWDEDSQLAAYNILCRMPPYDLKELFAAFVASSLRSGSGFSSSFDLAPLAAALAPDLAPDLTPDLTS